MNLGDDNCPFRVSIRSRSDSPAINLKLSKDDEDTGTLSDTATDVHAPDGVKQHQLQNGFNNISHENSVKETNVESESIISEKSPNSVSVFTNYVDNDSTNLSRPTKLRKGASSSFQELDNSLNSSSLVKDKGKDVKLPHFEESIVEGFSIMAFNTASDMEVCDYMT